MNTHSCLKCKNQYQDEDVEAYYCAPCLEEKKRVAAEVDARLASRPRKEIKSALQMYDENAVNVRGMRFLKVDLA